MEEISWGQRLFHVSTPEFFEEHNLQKEINLHNFASRYNLYVIYILIGGYGAFAFLIIPKCIPTHVKSSIDLFVPPWFLSTYFLPACMFFLYIYIGEPLGWWSRQRNSGSFILSRDQEPMEFLLSLGFLLFVWINWSRLTLGRFPGTPPLDQRFNPRS
jgi:hypothetical protein